MIIIALGANLPSEYGTPEETLYKSVETIQARGIDVLVRASVWLTAPVPVSEQPWYRNAVISVRSDMDAPDLMLVLHEIEEEFGRVRGEPNAPRVLDLDLIAYHNEIIEEEGLIVPHPRMYQRAFVLMPLAEIAPDWVHPVLHAHLGTLIAEIPEGQKAMRGEKLVA